MKKLTEFNLKEVRELILILQAETKSIIQDEGAKSVLTEFANARKEQRTSNITMYDAIDAIMTSLLSTNYRSFCKIVGAITQTPVDKVEELNNITIIETIGDFFQIPTYKKAFLRVMQSVIIGQ